MTYPTASLTADLCIFRVYTDKETHQPVKAEVLLIERGGEPFKGCLALPGGFVNASNEPKPYHLPTASTEYGETFLAAAIRELKEETGLDVTASVILLEPVGIYDEPGRDPRGRVISQAFFALVLAEEVPDVQAGDDAVRCEWVDVTELDSVDLAFDHATIVRDALSKTGFLSPAAL